MKTIEELRRIAQEKIPCRGRGKVVWSDYFADGKREIEREYEGTAENGAPVLFFDLVYSDGTRFTRYFVRLQCPCCGSRYQVERVRDKHGLRVKVIHPDCGEVDHPYKFEAQVLLRAYELATGSEQESPTEVVCKGNGAGAPSFELRRFCEFLGIPSRVFHDGYGPNGYYVCKAVAPTERWANALRIAAHWFVGGIGGAMFGVSDGK